MEKECYEEEVQPYRKHQTDTACSWLVCHSWGDCANCIHLHRLPGVPANQFFGEASRACPQHCWRSTYSLRETLNPIEHTGPLDVSRESGASAGQVKETPFSKEIGLSDPSCLHAGGVGRQQQQPYRKTD